MTVNSMTNITLPESLGFSVLGIIVVFIVLVFVMIIIYIMNAIAKKAAKKPAPEGDKGISAVSPPDAAQAVKEPSAQVPDAQPPAEAALAEPAPMAAAPKPSVPRKYKVGINGTEYEVGAEEGEGLPGVEAQAPAVPEPPVEAAPQLPAVHHKSPASTIEFSGVRKFKVVVDGSEYEVDAEMGSASTDSAAGRE